MHSRNLVSGSITTLLLKRASSPESTKPSGRGSSRRLSQLPEMVPKTGRTIARYVLGYSNFNRYGRYELGVAGELLLQGRRDDRLHQAREGAAETAGLKVGDHILEVDGAPVGQFGDRLYEVWRQYVYSKDGTVELLIAYDDPSTGQPRYYYP